MTNDLKLGGVDVADLRVGATQVSKVMLGSTQIWTPGGAPPAFAPTLTDFFADDYIVNTTSKLFEVPVGKVIPVGALLIVAATVNGIYLAPTMSDNASTLTGPTPNAYTLLSDSAWINASNNFGALFACKTTRSLDAGKFITLTHTGAARNRGAAVVAWFADAAHFPDLTPDGSVPGANGSSATWAVGPQSSPASTRTLDLAVPLGTGAGYPYGFTGYTKIADAATATGTSDRSVGLGYRVSTSGGARSASGSVAASAAWGAGLAALDYTL